MSIFRAFRLKLTAANHMSYKKMRTMQRPAQLPNYWGTQRRSRVTFHTHKIHCFNINEKKIYETDTYVNGMNGMLVI